MDVFFAVAVRRRRLKLDVDDVTLVGNDALEVKVVDVTARRRLLVGHHQSAEVSINLLSQSRVNSVPGEIIVVAFPCQKVKFQTYFGSSELAFCPGPALTFSADGCPLTERFSWIFFYYLNCLIAKSLGFDLWKAWGPT